MRNGIFGKLPIKRDFIALNLPAAFLTVWEEWLQTSIAVSRQDMGAAWQDRFLTAPVWRFWLGRNICGLSAIGALMPSVDGVGRYFPFSVCACHDRGESFAPPAIAPRHEWFTAVENIMLGGLRAESAEEPAALLAAVAALAETPVGAAGAAPDDVLSGFFLASLQDTLAEQSWWWSIGGPDYPVRFMRYTGLPDPQRFGDFLTVPEPAGHAA